MSGSENAPTDKGTAPSAARILFEKVLDHGEVSLVDFMGNDKSVARAARVSNGVMEDKELAQDEKLINYLIKHRHGSPFEHVTFTFYVKCPLFVRSEWMRHRMASYNEISGRYVKYVPEFYIPSEWRSPAEKNKQGSVYPDPQEIHSIESSGLTVLYGNDGWNSELETWTENIVNECYAAYEHMLKWGVANEMARMILPVNLYTQFYFTVNARGLMNFLSLRNADDAQFEIRQYASALERMFDIQLPVTYRAWVANGRDTP